MSDTQLAGHAPGPVEAPLFLEGRRVALRAVTEDEYVGYNTRWTNDPEVCALLNRGTYPTTPDDHRTEYRSRVGRHTDIELLMVEKASGEVVGITGLHSIQWIPRHLEFRILIGVKTAWNRGLGTDALVLLCRYAFERLNMNKVWLGVNLSNASAVASYEKCGFVREGVLRQEAWVQGRYHDVLRMSLLRGEMHVDGG